MGQTLTHGVYLPDEGERNCYNGLAANWSILDGAVGTVAEHSTQIAGKAPLVHTHTKSDITDFPVYGNTAGTICEGNDSRLSDARTPVAHTHSKADITDLFNSANTWSGDNTYFKTVAIERSTDAGNFLALKNTVAELGSTPASATPATIAFRDKNDDNLGYMGVYYDTDGSNHFRLYVRNKFTSGAPSTSGSYDYAFFGLRLNADKSKEGIIKATFRPYDNNTHDLGSSSYQWNNVYSKNYFYNGVAWGLDKANTWTDTNTFSAVSYGEKIRLKNTGLDLSSGNPSVSSTCQHMIWWDDKNNTHYAKIQAWANDANSTILLTSYYREDANTVRTSSLRNQCGASSKAFFPDSNSDTDLGTSTNKWKSFNGINPGALSLPSSDSADYIDLSSNLSANAEYQYTAPFDGWLCLYVIVNEFYTENAVGLYRSDTSANSHQWAKSVTAALNLYKQTRYQGSVMLPVESGKKYICYLSLNANTTVHNKHLFMYKNKGNV